MIIHEEKGIIASMQNHCNKTNPTIWNCKDNCKEDYKTCNIFYVVKNLSQLENLERFCDWAWNDLLRLVSVL